MIHDFPPITPTDVQDYLKFFYLFRKNVIRCIGPLPLDSESLPVKEWFIQVSGSMNWTGMRDIQHLLGSWEVLQSESGGQVFSVFNRIMAITLFEAKGHRLELETCYQEVVYMLLDLYPSARETDTLVRYDLSLENKLPKELIDDAIAQNEWLPYLMAFSLLSLEDIDYLVKGQYKELLDGTRQ